MSELKNMQTVARIDLIDKNLNRFEVQSRPGTSSSREIFKLCVNKGWVLSELTPIETRLEDIFRNLTLN
jgi:ABC-2 type transport system ATP-binding protein